MAMLPEVQCNDRDVAAFTPGKKIQIKSTFSGGLTSARMRVFFFKALVLKLRVQFKCTKHPERPFYVVSQGLDVRNIGLIIALTNHDHLHCKITLRYYESKIFL